MTTAEIWALVLAAASAIVILSNAIEKIIDFIQKAKAPANKQNSRLDALEKWKEEVDRKLIRDNDRLESILESNEVTQKAILALLDHGIDGNNIDQMKDAKEEVHAWLVHSKLQQTNK